MSLFFAIATCYSVLKVPRISFEWSSLFHIDDYDQLDINRVGLLITVVRCGPYSLVKQDDASLSDGSCFFY